MLKKPPRNLARKNLYQRPDKKIEENVVFVKQVPVHPKDKFDNLETIDYNNDTNINDPASPKKKSSTQVATEKLLKNTKTLQGKKRARDQFDDLDTIDYNNDTNINDLVPSKKKLGHKSSLQNPGQKLPLKKL